MPHRLNHNKTEKAIRNIYIVSFTLLLLSYVVTLYSNRQLLQHARLMEKTNRIIKNLDNVLSTVTDAETGTRGYIMTKERKFLVPFMGTRTRLESLFPRIEKEMKQNNSQMDLLRKLDTVSDKRLQMLEFSIDAFEKNNFIRPDTLKKLQPDAIRLMDSIRLVIRQMEEREEFILRSRTEKMHQNIRTINIITFISIAIAFSLAAFGLVTYIQISKAKAKIQKEVEDYQEELNSRITDLDKANTELIKMRSQEKFAATGRIARTIAHEVRNPLTNINLAADQLKSEIIANPESVDFLFEMITRNSSRINQLISDLLNSTKFSELNYEKTSAKDLIEATLKDAEDRIRLYNIKVVRKYDPSNPVISVDRVKMRIALLNIIINAIEAMEGKEEKVIKVETCKKDSRIQVIVEDNGLGMDEENLLRVFEPYFTSKPKGNGLGLTNTQNIILNHNGEISVTSVKNAGTKFTISLG